MSLERDIAQIEESHENRRLAFNAKFWLDILPKDWFLSIFHKTDGNRRLAKLLDISEVEWHKRGADNVVTLVRFYRKHLPHVVRHMSFWYMSRDNVKWRTPAEATALYVFERQNVKTYRAGKWVWSSYCSFLRDWCTASFCTRSFAWNWRKNEVKYWV